MGETIWPFQLCLNILASMTDEVAANDQNDSEPSINPIPWKHDISNWQINKRLMHKVEHLWQHFAEFIVIFFPCIVSIWTSFMAGRIWAGSFGWRGFWRLNKQSAAIVDAAYLSSFPASSQNFKERLFQRCLLDLTLQTFFVFLG